MRRMLPIVLMTRAHTPSLGNSVSPEPTEMGVLAIAAKHSTVSMLSLQGQNEEAVENVKRSIQAAGNKEEQRKIALDGAVSSLTLSLASGCSLAGITIASAYLVKEFPKDPRALNLFAAVLHTQDEYADAIAVYEYCLTLNKNASILRLNLAVCYLDADQDQKAFLLLDKLRYDDADNRAVWKALAAYYFKQKDWNRFRECLLRSATFAGYREKKTKDRLEEAQQSNVMMEDSLPEMEEKLKELSTVIPMTTADILEEDFPDAAKQVRDHNLMLTFDETYRLPDLPECNLNGPSSFTTNLPIVEAWTEAALSNLMEMRKDVYRAKGIDPDAPEEVVEKQGFNAAMGDMADAIQIAKQAMKMMQGMNLSGMNIPGISPQQMEKVQKQMEEVSQQFGGLMEEEKPLEEGTLPGADSGSVFSQVNWENYLIIYNSYMLYLRKYWQDYDAKVKAVIDRYSDKVREEERAWAEEWENLQLEHRDIRMSERHTGDVDLPCRRSQIQHKRRLNGFADTYFKQWQPMFFQEYRQRMKPITEAFYYACILYVRNMNDDKVMLREYQKVIESVVQYSERAVNAIGMGGGFSYHPEVEEEEEQLERDIAAARDDADARRPGFISEWPAPEEGYTDWVEKHFVVEVALEVVALKITAHDIDIKFQVPEFFSGVKYDFEKDKLSTYTGVGNKLEMGVNVCGAALGKLAVGVELYRRTATWDFQNGKYYETDTAKAEATIGAGPLKAGVEATMDTQLHAKVKAKATISATDEASNDASIGATLQWQKDYYW